MTGNKSKTTGETLAQSKGWKIFILANEKTKKKKKRLAQPYLYIRPNIIQYRQSNQKQKWTLLIDQRDNRLSNKSNQQIFNKCQISSL